MSPECLWYSQKFRGEKNFPPCVLLRTVYPNVPYFPRQYRWKLWKVLFSKTCRLFPYGHFLCLHICLYCKRWNSCGDSNGGTIPCEPIRRKKFSYRKSTKKIRHDFSFFLIETVRIKNGWRCKIVVRAINVKYCPICRKKVRCAVRGVRRFFIFATTNIGCGSV